MQLHSFDRSRRFDELETAIADQEAKIADCRRSVIGSRAAVIGAMGLLAAAFTIFSSLQTPTIVFAALAAFIGGLVWGGASRSSLQEAEASLTRLLDAKSREIDAVAISNGWQRSDTLH